MCIDFGFGIVNVSMSGVGVGPLVPTDVCLDFGFECVGEWLFKHELSSRHTAQISIQLLDREYKIRAIQFRGP